MIQTKLDINFDRLKSDILTLGEIGRTDGDDRGIYRQAFTDADMQARDWLKNRIIEAKMECDQDGAANIIGRVNPQPDVPVISIGSHIDTVPAAGMLDGSLGVLVGLECLRRIREENIQTEFPLELVAFTDEEGRFGGLFGSQSMVGEVTLERIQTAADLEGNLLKDVMAGHGLDAVDALRARRGKGAIKAYLELHIEQGPVLDQSPDHNVGVVTHITGLFKWAVRLIGAADHAGTTPMPMRKDALMGLAEFAYEIQRILDENGGPNSVATIGRAALFPGTANTVPGRVDFSIDCRDTDPGVLDALGDAFQRALSAIARRRGLMFEYDVLSEVAPVPCDPDIVDVLRKHATERGMNFMELPSGAAHDAQIMARIAPVGMIFVPSIDGRSHSPAEWSHWEDIETGANLTLSALLELAKVKS